MGFRLKPTSVTLDDLELQQGQIFVGISPDFATLGGNHG